MTLNIDYDAALAAKDAQIDRLKEIVEALKVQHEEMLLKGAREQNIALEALAAALQEIERLKQEPQSTSHAKP